MGAEKISDELEIIAVCFSHGLLADVIHSYGHKDRMVRYAE